MLVKLTDTLQNFIFYKRYLTSILSHGMGWDGMGWDGTGWDENFTKSSHPIGRKIFRSIPSHDGTEILRSVPPHGTEFFFEVSHPMMG